MDNIKSAIQATVATLISQYRDEDAGSMSDDDFLAIDRMATEVDNITHALPADHPAKAFWKALKKELDTGSKLIMDVYYENPE